MAVVSSDLVSTHFDVDAPQKRSRPIGNRFSCDVRKCGMNVISDLKKITQNASMKPKQIFISILAALFVFPLMGTFAQQAPNSVSIRVITTFDYPGTVISTQPQKINDGGDIVAIYVDSLGVQRGFVRFNNGKFSAPIVEPNDTGNLTQGRGINNSRTVCGDYIGSDSFDHGFFLSGSTFTEYNFPGAIATVVLGINNVADFVGGFSEGNGIFQAFVSLGGTITPFSVPGASSAFAYQLNRSNQVVGYYTDSSGVPHGYFRDTNGALHFPIDPSGSTGTFLFGINDSNWVVGRYADSSGVTHGLFFVPPNKFVTFDYPGSTSTSLNGINAAGFICGRYRDASGIEHGILARVTGVPQANEADTEMKWYEPPSLVTPLNPPSLVRPVNPLPSAWQGEMPAW
jgi:hypothetical protein